MVGQLAFSPDHSANLGANEFAHLPGEGSGRDQDVPRSLAFQPFPLTLLDPAFFSPCLRPGLTAP